MRSLGKRYRWDQEVLVGEMRLPGYQEGDWAGAVPVPRRVGTFRSTLQYRSDPPKRLEYPWYPLSHPELEGCRDETRNVRV